jgi:hypothetical protein
VELEPELSVAKLVELEQKLQKCQLVRLFLFFKTL